ncbi:MAG: SMP-30/gluconolactonase/LRE family protein [Acidobacteria bacterium]|nr:SMP-30/gluconolactonase/LRE family protein [Acidobacteriota bacterium]
MQEFTKLVGGFAFTECPRWHNGHLYFSDQHGYRVYQSSTDGFTDDIAIIPNRPGGLGFLPDGRLLIASMCDRIILRLEEDGSLALHADLSALAPGDINDMLVDHAGRAWVGNFGFDLHGGAPARPTSLICVDPDGSARIASEDLGFPNGMAITPDGRTLIVAETLMNRLSAFDLHNGKLGPRRTWAAFGDAPISTSVSDILAHSEVVPDGICLDAEGAVWVADLMHHRLLRVQVGGRILREFSTPLSPFACMLGGDDGRTLFICVAPTFHEAEAKTLMNSSILTTRVEVPHAGLP